MSQEKKAFELNDEELKKVTGGIIQNADGTYNVPIGEEFYFYNKKIVA